MKLGLRKEWAKAILDCIDAEYHGGVSRKRDREYAMKIFQAFPGLQFEYAALYKQLKQLQGWENE